MAFYQYSSSKPMPAFNFLVFIGPMPLSFSKVSSIEIAIETQALAEGGENRYVHSLSGPISTEKVISFEKGVPAEGIGTMIGMAANTMMRVGSTFDMIIVTVLDQSGKPKKVFVLSDAILRKRSFSELDAISGNIFIESLEFVYEDLTEIPGASLLFTGIDMVVGGKTEELMADEAIRLNQLRDPTKNRGVYTKPLNTPPWPASPKKYKPYAPAKEE